MSDTSRPTISVAMGMLITLLALMAFGLALYAIALARQVMDLETKAVFEIQTLQAQLNSLKETTNSKLSEDLSAKKSSDSPAVQAASTVWLPNRSVEGNEPALESELELLADKLRVQFSTNPDAIHIAAMIKAQTRKYEEAQTLWERCLQLSPGNEMYMVNLATTAIEQGDNARALEVLCQAPSDGPRSFDMLYHRGLSLTKLGRLEEAINTLQAANDLRPDSAEIWLMLGQSQLELGRPVEAEAALRKAKQLGAESPSLLVGLGNACARQGKREEAKEFFDQFNNIKDADKLTGIQRYQALSGREIRQTALSSFRDAAIFFSKQKNFLETERLLQLSLIIDASNRDVLLTLADLYYRNQKTAEERYVRERILELGSAGFQDYVNLAKTHAILNDRNSAEAILKLAVVVFPNLVQPYAALSQFHMETQNWTTARWYAQQSLDRQPSAEGFRFLASICDKMQDTNAAEQARSLAAQLENEKQLQKVKQ